jgi:hypothetical protein
LVGLINGAANGLIVFAVAYFYDANPMLGLVLFLAMTGNLVVAGLTGAYPADFEKGRDRPGGGIVHYHHNFYRLHRIFSATMVGKQAFIIILTHQNEYEYD